MVALDKNVITSETDDKGVIVSVSEAFCEISGYKKDELIGKTHNIMRHPDMSSEIFEDLWKTIKEEKIWIGEIKNFKRNGEFYWCKVVITLKCTNEGADCGYTAIKYDITDKKAVEDLTANLEVKIAQRTVDLKMAKKEIEATHKYTKDSIEYASLIQEALIPRENSMTTFFNDHFVTWIPKNTVGGDSQNI